ncbi:MAG: alpha-L-fucosidase [Candidatus Omnitrophota bacterium]
MKTKKTSTFLMILLSCALAGGVEPSTEKIQRTNWFQKAGWGVFVHYLSDVVAQGEKTSPEEWNRIVGAMDVKGLANQLASVGAGYCVITLGQNSGHYCSPNAAYDKIVGIAPSKCSTRDLVGDLSDAIKPKGIRLMAYLPAGAPDRDPAAMKALEWRNGRYPLWQYPNGGPDGGDLRLENFQRKWESIISEWSLRWKDKVSGWWFDGCYFPVAMYQHPDPPNFASFAAAARAGNPNSIVAFNPGVRYPIVSLTPEEDYTAGEANEPDKVKCQGRWAEGAQFQMLCYLGENWGHGSPRFTNEQIINWTRDILSHQGVVTWEVPIQASGLIPQPFIDQLSAIHAALKKNENNR